MNVDWRWAAGPAAVAFVLSLLTGVLAGVEFITLLLRAILGSVLFSVVGTGIGFLVQRQLPELLDAQPRSSAETPHRVDITVGDEDAAGASEGEPPTDEEGELASLEAEEIESIRPKEDEGESELAPPRQASQQDITESLVEEVEEAALPDEELSKASQFDEEEEGQELESVDELPDIGGFEGAFDDGTGAEGGEGYGGEESSLSDFGSGTKSKRSAPEGFDAGNDPAQIAKALQTMLKRDS